MSITLWRAMITFGYGDMYPISMLWRILTVFVSFLGIAFYAIHGNIFTASLLEKIQEKKRNKDYMLYGKDLRSVHDRRANRNRED